MFQFKMFAVFHFPENVGDFYTGKISKCVIHMFNVEKEHTCLTHKKSTCVNYNVHNYIIHM